MLTAESALALFSMLAISSVSLLIAQKLKAPHTVLLVAIGVVLGVFSHFPYLGFLNDLTLTPELLFFVFLPTLIFESAYNIQIKQLMREASAISVLAVVGLLTSTVLIALGLDFGFGLIDFEVPFILLLIFGAIISATDPVAVLALFKEYGAPRRLSLIFEGESIFNDGTAVALFVILLGIAEAGIFEMSDVSTGIVAFVQMIIGGVVFGLISGGVFAKLVGWVRKNEFAAITLTMALAHTTFICAEIISERIAIGGFHLYASPIIATAVASLLMGNYGRYKMPAHASEFVEKYWSQFAFLSNSLVFIMIGLLTISLPESAPGLLVPVLLTIVVVAIARAVTIYPLVTFFNTFAHADKKIPDNWQHVLAWGSLRGALAVTMVLLIPDDLAFDGWTLAYTPKELILSLTVGCVFATLFIKATTIGMLMNKLKLNTFTPTEEINYREMLIYIYNVTLKRLKAANDKGHIHDEAYAILKAEQHERIQSTFQDLVKRRNPKIVEKVIHLYAIGIERKHAKALYEFGEITESIIRRIMGKLEYQSYAIERDIFDSTKYRHGADKDIFEKLADITRLAIFRKEKESAKIKDTYLYYRGLSILARKVVKELNQLNMCFEEACEAPSEAIHKIADMYRDYRKGSIEKMEELHTAHPELCTRLDVLLARKSVQKRELDILEDLREREMVTPKVSIALHEHFLAENSEKV